MNGHAYNLTGAALLCWAAVASLPASASAREHGKDNTPVTLTGCIQKEKVYRELNDIGRGRFFGAGEGDEYVMLDAQPGPAKPMTPEQASCANVGTGRTYEMTGHGEKSLWPFVGKRVEITGMLKHADSEVAVDASGAVVAIQPTGGRGARRDLKLFEVNVASFQEIPIIVPARAAAEPAPRTAAEPSPPAYAELAIEPLPPPATIVVAELEPIVEPVHAARAARGALPKTASSLPIVGLVGLFSLVSAFGVQVLGRR